MLADVLDAAHDPASAAEAWRRAGEASTFREGYTSILRSIAAALPADAEPTQRYLDLSYAIGMAAAVPLPFLQKINRRCKDPARWDVCLRIADVASRDGDTLITLMVAKAVTQSAHAPDFLLRRREERLHALQWALSEIGRSIDVDAAEAGDREAVAAANRSMETMLSRGELGAATDYLTSHRITQSEAAARYTAWIEALRLAAPAPAEPR